MKRAVCLVILFSMVMHCASRLGLISYLYDNRHDIAYSMGLIGGVPIAMCEAEYFTKDAPLVIHLPDNTDDKLPAHSPQAREIVLFVQDTDKPVLPHFSGTCISHNTFAFEALYPAPIPAIFHPPC